MSENTGENPILFDLNLPLQEIIVIGLNSGRYVVMAYFGGE